MAMDTATPALPGKSGEKKKWQIALRRYVLEKNISVYYAPYFGLDIEKMRTWFQVQFPKDIGWEDAGAKWQFDHVIPVTHFDFSSETELKMCWNFVNLRIEVHYGNKENISGMDMIAARNYFTQLYQASGYKMAAQLLGKIDSIESIAMPHTIPQQQFLKENARYLNQAEGFGSYEFEKINRGTPIQEVEKEMAILKKFSK